MLFLGSAPTGPEAFVELSVPGHLLHLEGAVKKKVRSRSTKKTPSRLTAVATMHDFQLSSS